MSKYLSQKDLQQLRRLLLGDGRSPADIDRLFKGPPQLVVESYQHYYQGLTAADRNRLFANADRLKRNPLGSGAGLSPGVGRVLPKPIEPAKDQDGERRGRGRGKVPAGESFTLVLPAGLLAQCRELAYSEQRSVAQVIRLAILAYLRPPSGD